MPLQKLTRKERRFRNKPWISSAIKVSIRKQKMFKLSKKKNDQKYTAEYKSYRNLLTRTKKAAYEDYYQKKITLYGKNKSKTWELINEITKRKRKSKTLVKSVKHDRHKLKDATSISDYLNKQ